MACFSYIHYFEDKNTFHIYLSKGFKKDFFHEIFDNKKSTEKREEFLRNFNDEINKKYPQLKKTHIIIKTGIIVISRLELSFPLNIPAASKNITSLMKNDSA